MVLRHGVREFLTGFTARSPRPRAKFAALAALSVVFVMTAMQLLASTCNTYEHGFEYSVAVPCQYATCAYWAAGAPNQPLPTCSSPNGLTITRVSIVVTEDAWSVCTRPGTNPENYGACSESAVKCARYWMYGDNDCTVACPVVNYLPLYCKML